MNALADATLGITGGMNWSEQTAFLSSEYGAEYYTGLSKELAFSVEKLRGR
jgi:hypothetical protein